MYMFEIFIECSYVHNMYNKHLQKNIFIRAKVDVNDDEQQHQCMCVPVTAIYLTIHEYCRFIYLR